MNCKAPLPANKAFTDNDCVIVTAQEPVPLHAPLQPENVQPEAGAAFRVTCVFGW